MSPVAPPTKDDRREEMREPRLWWFLPSVAIAGWLTWRAAESGLELTAKVAAASGCLGLLALVVHRGRKRWLGLCAGFACVSGTGLAILSVGFFALVGEAPISSEAEWPSALTSIAALDGADRASAHAADLGGYIDTEAAWCIRIDARLLPEAQRLAGVEPIEPSSIPRCFWTAFPRAWHPTARAGQRCFATPGFPVDSTRPGGVFLMAVFDPGTGFLHVWEKRNFG